MEFNENYRETKNETLFQVGQNVTWKPEVSENPGFNNETKKRDHTSAAFISLMKSSMPAKILKIEGKVVFLDIPGYQNAPCNSESLMLAE